MREVEDYPWGELVPGAYVYDAKNVLWKLLESHPEDRHHFLAVGMNGATVKLKQEPTKRVTAIVPDEDEALHHLAKHLGARAWEGQATVEAMPMNNTAGTRARYRSHLKLLHGHYCEPSLKFGDLVEMHTALHAMADYSFPHTHLEPR